MSIDDYLEEYTWDWDIFALDDFGVFHLNIIKAAELIVKILCLEGQLETELPEKEGDGYYTLSDPALDKLLIKEIDKYKKFLISGIEKGTLQASHILLNSDETVNSDKTYLKVETLIEWLDQRSIHIVGDWYEEYQKNEEAVAEAAIRAISIKREMIKRNISKTKFSSIHERMTVLEKLVEDLQAEKMASWRSGFQVAESHKSPVKPLHTKERETLLRMIIGMATDGYGFNPKLPRSPIPKEIADLLTAKGLPLDPDTVRKWLKEAADLLPDNE